MSPRPSARSAGSELRGSRPNDQTYFGLSAMAGHDRSAVTTWQRKRAALAHSRSHSPGFQLQVAGTLIRVSAIIGHCSTGSAEQVWPFGEIVMSEVPVPRTVFGKNS